MIRQRITFELTEGAATIVQRAAARCGLRVLEPGPVVAGYHTFVVELSDSFDAYRLGQECVTDPDWFRHVQPRSRR